jgi:ferredoxin
VRVEGPVSPPTPTELHRLSRPPHQPESGLRLACQTNVLGDVQVIKHEGLWGQHTDSPGTPRGRAG